MSLAMLASQASAQQIEPEASIDKWKLYRALCDARQKLGVTDRGLALLNALLTFYPKAELSVDAGLVVFPSNAQLSTRAHGMAEQTMRRHLSVLVDAGLITRKDSANGKRFARRDRGGEIDEAYGFSLAPLLARAQEIEMLADDVNAERLQFQRMKERLTICRRDVAKLIEAALDEGASGNWEKVHLQFRDIVAAIPRSPTLAQVADTLDEMELLRDGIVNMLELQIKALNQGGNHLQNERHIQNSKPESTIESEPLSETEQGRNSSKSTTVEVAEPKSYPLGMVLQACPQIADYGPDGKIGSWRELMAAAVVVRSMLGVSPSAYQDACEVLGAGNAATVMACILERAGHINSAGGYLRALTDRARKGEFGLGPMLMSLLKANAEVHRRAG
jgi:replication initiation protein RepC